MFSFNGWSEQSSMPAGDPQKVWFHEMLARLQREWRETMSFAPRDTE
jgi:hypothetical protein